MKSLERRVRKIEESTDPENRLAGFEILIEDSQEQVNHPERFKKVLDKEENENGFIIRWMHWERK